MEGNTEGVLAVPDSSVVDVDEHDNNDGHPPPAKRRRTTSAPHTSSTRDDDDHNDEEAEVEEVEGSDSSMLLCTHESPTNNSTIPETTTTEYINQSKPTTSSSIVVITSKSTTTNNNDKIIDNDFRFRHLPKELLATVASFLTKSEVAVLVNNTDRCLASKIKHTYLYRNYKYLIYSTGGSDLLRSSTVAWMEVNHDWRDLYDTLPPLEDDEEGSSSGIGGDNNNNNVEQYRGFRDIFCDIFNAMGLHRIEIVKHLIEVRGVNPHVVQMGTKSLPPLHAALILRNEVMLEYFLSLPDVDVNVRDEEKQTTPLHMVSTFEEGGTELLKLLLSHPDIDVNARHGESQATALVLAILNGGEHSLVLIQLLVQHANINVNATLVHGITALHIVCEMMPDDAVVIVTMLLEAGADPNAVASNGLTPWMVAKRSCKDVNHVVLRLLKEAGAVNVGGVNFGGNGGGGGGGGDGPMLGGAAAAGGDAAE